MIIYIAMETSARELPGHLLFSAVAASRGHQIVIINSNDLWLYLRLGLMEAGCILTKNMNIPVTSEKMFQRYVDSGFDLYCQDQEPPILWERFENFLSHYNITTKQMLPFKAVFCYGNRDSKEYSTFFTESDDMFIDTGTPRADLWSTKFSRLHLNKETEVSVPYIMVVSNFGYWMGRRHLSELMLMLQKIEIANTFQQEENLFRFLEEDARVYVNMLLAIKHLAASHPTLRIVVRPHPDERVDYWHNIFGKHQNVEVIGNTDPITPWIVGATAVIQNGCTSAMESVLLGIPVISHGSDRTQSYLSVPNKLGIRTQTLTELDEALQKVERGEYAPYQDQSEKVLEPLVTTGGNAALKMVRIMETKSRFPAERRLSQIDLMKLRSVRLGKNMIDGLRRLFNFKGPKPRGYTLNLEQIKRNMAEIAGVMELPVPKVRAIGKTGILIEKV